MLKLILGLLLVGTVNYVYAAQLQYKYRDKNNDLICVYDSHGHDVYVNVGFSGHCSFSVTDSEINN